MIYRVNQLLLIIAVSFLWSCDLVLEDEGFQNLYLDNPVTFSIDSLNEKKNDISSGNSEFNDAYNSLLTQAENILEMDLVSVTFKTVPSPAPSLNDYVSTAPYWWPDPAQADGLPFIWQDGVRNPMADEFDRPRLAALRSRLEILSLAYYLSLDDRFAEKAMEYIVTWFIDPETRMNPNLRYAQGIMGHVDGRPIGIIDGNDFIYILDSISLIQSYDGWTELYHDRLYNWFEELYTWVATGYFGVLQSQANNNLGSWYDTQIAAYAHFLQDHTALDTLITKYPEKRLNPHINEHGIQIREINRSLSLHYSVFNLEAITISAKISESHSYNIWRYGRHSESDILLAINYLIPYLTNEKQWIRQQTSDFNPCRAIPMLDRASNYTGDSKYYHAKSRIINSCSNEIKLKHL